MTKRVMVIVEGCKYIVEVGDLRERPIKATVNQKTYLVQIPPPGATTETPEDAAALEHAIPVSAEVDCASISAPMPGDILEVNVKPGQRVVPGEPLCVLEAMKMKNLIRSSREGVIASVEVSAGQSVDYGDILVTFE